MTTSLRALMTLPVLTLMALLTAGPSNPDPLPVLPLPILPLPAPTTPPALAALTPALAALLPGLTARTTSSPEPTSWSPVPLQPHTPVATTRTSAAPVLLVPTTPPAVAGAAPTRVAPTRVAPRPTRTTIGPQLVASPQVTARVLVPTAPDAATPRPAPSAGLATDEPEPADVALPRSVVATAILLLLAAYGALSLARRRR